MSQIMTDEEAIAMSEKVALILVMCRGLDADEVKEWAKIAREQQSRHDAWTAMVDPTGWMRDKHGVDAAARIATAFSEFHTAVMENIDDR